MRAVTQGFLNMRTIKANKREILAKVRENRTKHIEEYKEAIHGYKEQLRQLLGKGMCCLSDQIERIDSGELFYPTHPNLALKMPESHEKDYNQVISMLEFETSEFIDVKSDEFACYVMDDWDWKDSFSATNALYKSSKS